MTIYTVHIRNNPERPGFVLVKDGFNWMAAIFGFFWALCVGAWGVALVLFAVEMLVGAVLKNTIQNAQMIGVIQFGVAVIVGFSANEIRRLFLQRAGLVESGLVVASNKADGERRYLDAHPDITASLLENS